MEDFNTALNTVFKYSVSHFDLLRELESNPAEHAAGSHLRGIAADALDDFAGEHPIDHPDRKSLEAQARLLRSEHPIYFWKGKAHHQKENSNRHSEFENGYISAALMHSPLHEGIPDDEESIGTYYEYEHLQPELQKDLSEDAAHFLHSYGHHIPEGREYNAGQAFFDVRNGLFDWTFHNHPEFSSHSADQLDAAASAAGRYRPIVVHGPQPDQYTPEPAYVVGQTDGNEQQWGQPAGLAE